MSDRSGIRQSQPKPGWAEDTHPNTRQIGPLRAANVHRQMLLTDHYSQATLHWFLLMCTRGGKSPIIMGGAKLTISVYLFMFAVRTLIV